MELSKEQKSSLLWVMSELSTETKLAKQANIMAVRKHVERISSLQLRLNGEIVKALCYGK